MRGDFSRLPVVNNSNVTAVLHQQGRVLTDYDLNEQNLLLRQRIEQLERLLVNATKQDDGTLGGSEVKVNAAEINVAGDGVTLSPYLQFDLAGLFKTPSGQREINRQALARLHQSGELPNTGEGESYVLYALSQRETYLPSAGQYLSQAVRLRQRTLLRVESLELTDIQASQFPKLEVAGRPRNSSMYRFNIHDVAKDADDTDANGEGKWKVWLKATYTNLMTEFTADVNGMTVSFSDGDLPEIPETARIEFFYPEEETLLADSTRRLRQLPLYQVSASSNSSWELSVDERLNSSPHPIPNVDGQCRFVVWDWTQVSELGAVAAGFRRADFMLESLTLGVTFASATVQDRRVPARYDWTINVEASDGVIIGGSRTNGDPVFTFEPTISFRKLLKFTVGDGGLSVVATHFVQPQSQLVAQAENNPTDTEDFTEASLDTSTPPVPEPEVEPIGVRDMPVSMLDLRFLTPELRQWAASVELSEVAGLPEASLTEKILRSVPPPSGRETLFAQDISSFATQIAAVSERLTPSPSLA